MPQCSIKINVLVDFPTPTHNPVKIQDPSSPNFVTMVSLLQSACKLQNKENVLPYLYHLENDTF